tara:strand:+ start:847 stop:1119 length:273 start_codon:yes stop_codon:yes gene_type:complete
MPRLPVTLVTPVTPDGRGTMPDTRSASGERRDSYIARNSRNDVRRIIHSIEGLEVDETIPIPTVVRRNLSDIFNGDIFNGLLNTPDNVQT